MLSCSAIAVDAKQNDTKAKMARMKSPSVRQTAAIIAAAAGFHQRLYGLPP
jgi:hypothetical protein